MSAQGEHPQDFTPYLDRDCLDKRYDEIRMHLETCPDCRSEVEVWRSVDRVFRAPELEIDIPPFQWRQIRVRLESHEAPAGWLERLAEQLKPRALAWKVAFVTSIVAVIVFSGLQYHGQLIDKQLVALTHYSQSEKLRLAGVENPFRRYGVTERTENPFTSLLESGSNTNPFIIRR